MSTFKKVTLEQLCQHVVNTDGFNGNVMALDVLHVLEIALKRCIGFNVIVDGSMDVDLGNGHVLHCFVGLSQGLASKVTSTSKKAAKTPAPRQSTGAWNQASTSLARIPKT